MTTSPTPTTSTSPSASAKPLSPFEGRAQVKVLRQWAVAAAKDINADAASFPRSAKLETSAGQKEVSTVVMEPSLGRYYPGPVPFTPVAVRSAGATSEVFVCLETNGFSVDAKTRAGAGKRHVIGGKITLRKESGRWLVDSLYSDEGTDCSGVKVAEVTW